MSASSFTADDANWDITLPGETASAKLIRTLYANIALGFAESGCPLSPEQEAVLRAGIAAVSK
jgi:hypothetical protein